ncbi:hypothetical protein [Pantoea ananatis]|uniref:hypothetical protein n=1 Tax=Pantoea ananas TaxID=553 RepID=UPI0021F76B36|nr:hypothetical protein [Pantoea ananatis]
MTTHDPRTRGSRWLKWLLLLIALLMVAAVAWRLMGHKGAGGTLPARGHAGSLQRGQRLAAGDAAGRSA